MYKITAVFALIGLLLTGCEKKDDNPVTPTPTSGNIFTSSNIKVKPVYFSFDTKDSVSSTSNWDIKLTTVYAPDDSSRSFPFPGIVLNAAKNVLGTYTDTKYENVDPATVTGFTSDITDTVTTFATNNIKTGPVYFSFEKRDTVQSTGTWDIKFTVDAMFQPLVMVNRSAGVTAQIIEQVPFSFSSAASAASLTSDQNDTTLVIGTGCLQYNPTTHRLSPYAERYFVVKTKNGSRIIFKINDYYNTAGASGFMNFTFISPEKYAIGSSCLLYAGPPTHKLNPYADRTFVVKTVAGKFAKFKLLTYYNDAGASGYMKFEYEVK